jgi:hypothetical protein
MSYEWREEFDRLAARIADIEHVLNTVGGMGSTPLPWERVRQGCQTLSETMWADLFVVKEEEG